jgi:hypothetical protein
MSKALRMFKVYSRNGASEVCFAESPVVAAGIARTIWGENGHSPRKFSAWELTLPLSVLKGEGRHGLVLELVQSPSEFVVRKGRLRLVAKGEDLRPEKVYRELSAK